MKASAERQPVPHFESHPATNGGSVIRRGPEGISVPVEAANVFRGSGEGAKVQNVSYNPLDIVSGETMHAVGQGVEVARFLASEHLLKILGAIGVLKLLKKFGIGFGLHRRW